VMAQDETGLNNESDSRTAYFSEGNTESESEDQRLLANQLDNAEGSARSSLESAYDTKTSTPSSDAPGSRLGDGHGENGSVSMSAGLASAGETIEDNTSHTSTSPGSIEKPSGSATALAGNGSPMTNENAANGNLVHEATSANSGTETAFTAAERLTEQPEHNQGNDNSVTDNGSAGEVIAEPTESLAESNQAGVGTQESQQLTLASKDQTETSTEGSVDEQNATNAQSHHAQADELAVINDPDNADQQGHLVNGSDATSAGALTNDETANKENSLNESTQTESTADVVTEMPGASGSTAELEGAMTNLNPEEVSGSLDKLSGVDTIQNDASGAGSDDLIAAGSQDTMYNDAVDSSSFSEVMDSAAASANSSDALTQGKITLAQEPKWMISPFFSFDRSSYSIDQVSLLNLTTSSSQLQLGGVGTTYTAGLRVAYRPTGHLWLESGFLYSRKSSVKGVMELYTPGGAIPVAAANYQLSGEFFEIPLVLGVRNNNDEFGWYFKAGAFLAYNRPSSNSFFEYYDFEAERLYTLKPSYQTLNPAVSVSAGFEYNITPNLRCYAEPTFRFSNRPMLNTTDFELIPVNPKWSTMGLGVGINYYFGKP